MPYLSYAESRLHESRFGRKRSARSKGRGNKRLRKSKANGTYV